MRTARMSAASFVALHALGIVTIVATSSIARAQTEAHAAARAATPPSSQTPSQSASQASVETETQVSANPPPHDDGALHAAPSQDAGDIARAPSDVETSVAQAADLIALAQRDIDAARPLLRRAARTSSSAALRAVALRLLGQHDPSAATARICARALRVDEDFVARRAGAECLGRLPPAIGVAYTPALIAALDDDSIDVTTMAGWALVNVGDASCAPALVAHTRHPDVRVGRLFVGYSERVRTRLLPSTSAADAGAAVSGVPSSGAPAAADNVVPPGVALLAQADSVDELASTAWLGLYGASVGWMHGVLVTSAQGGTLGATISSLVGLAAAASGAAAGAGYSFSHGDNIVAAHTVVQLGTLGTIAGFGAGQLAVGAPLAAVASSNLALIGTLAGTALGVALVETAPPGLDALGAGLVAALGVSVGAGALASSYGYLAPAAIGAMLVSGGAAGAATTLALSTTTIGLYPLAGTAVGMLGAAGAASIAVGAMPSLRTTGTPGWVTVGALSAGAATGFMLSSLLPSSRDPLRDPSIRVLRFDPPTISLLPGAGIRADPVAVAIWGGRF